VVDVFLDLRPEVMGTGSGIFGFRVLGRQDPRDQNENGNNLFTQKRISHITATKGPENLCKNTPLLQKKKAFIALFQPPRILVKTKASIHSIKQFGQAKGLQEKAKKVGDEKSEELQAAHQAIFLVSRIEKKKEK